MEDTYQARADFLMTYHGGPLSQCRAQSPEWTKQLVALQPGSVEESMWLSEFCKKAFTLPAKPVEAAKTEEPVRYTTKAVDVIRQAFATAWLINAVEATSENCLYLAGCEQTDWEEFANSVAPLDRMPDWVKMTAPESTVPVPAAPPFPSAAPPISSDAHQPVPMPVPPQPLMQPRLQDITSDPVRAAFEEGWRCSGRFNHGAHTSSFLSQQCAQCLKEYVATIGVQAPCAELGVPGTDLYRRQHAAMVHELTRTCALSTNKANSIVSTLLDVAFEAGLSNG